MVNRIFYFTAVLAEITNFLDASREKDCVNLLNNLRLIIFGNISVLTKK